MRVDTRCPIPDPSSSLPRRLLTRALGAGCMLLMRFRGSGPKTRTIEPSDLAARLAGGWNPRLIDVRTSLERRIERIPGSEHLPMARALAGPRTVTGPAVVVCRSGHRARLAAARAGGDEVMVLAGGTRGWIKAGLPVERGPEITVRRAGGPSDKQPAEKSDPSWFDRMMGAIDAAGMRRWRREAAGELRGRALELGAGTGRNSRFIPNGVDLIAVEPDLEALRFREAEGRSRGRAVVARGEELPFGDGTFDSALSTLVLCSVDDQPKVASELRRVLKRGASLSAIDHVLADNRALARFQRWRGPAWYRRTESCRIDRQSLDRLREAGFEVVVRAKRLFGVFVLYRATPLST